LKAGNTDTAKMVPAVPEYKNYIKLTE